MIRLNKNHVFSKEFVINKFLPVFSVFFFVFWRFFFNFLLWRGRVLPPEPGDVLNYLRWIKNIETSYVKLTSGGAVYTFILGNIVKLFSLTPETVFYYSFWLGFVLLAMVLWYFFKKLNFSPIQTMLCFLLLAFYTGHGSFGGFYWVVPSFFAFLTFLYLFSAAASDKKINWWFVGAVAFIFPLIHGTGIFALAIFILYPILYFVLLNLPKFSLKNLINKIDYQIIRRCIFIILIGIFSYSLITVLLPKINADSPRVGDKIMGYSEVFPAFIKSSLGENLSLQLAAFLKNAAKGYSAFHFNYLNKIIPNIFFIFLWIFIFGVLFYYKKYKILALYFATFIFSFLSSLLYYKGYKSLLYLWPITYILVGYSFYFIYIFIKNLPKNLPAKPYLKFIHYPIFIRLLKICFVVSILGFYLFNVAYSFYYINLKNQDMNISYNPKMFDRIITDYSPKDTILYFDDYFTINEFFYNNEKNYEYYPLQTVSYKENLKSEHPKKMVIILEDDKIYQQTIKESKWKGFLEAVAKFFNISTGVHSLIPDDKPKSIEGKLVHFYLPVDRQFHKILYKNENVYIFELIAPSNI